MCLVIGHAHMDVLLGAAASGAVRTVHRSLDEGVEQFIAPMRAVAPQAHRAFKALARATRDRTGAEEIELRHFASSWAHPDHWAAHDQFMNRKRG